MTVKGASIGVGCGGVVAGCADKFGCPPGVCPDFTIKRHDTKPPFKVSIEDCDGAFDLTDGNLVLEANMWAKAKLKKAITSTDTYFALADNIGFEQVMVGDIIIMERVRLPEHMLVTGFDETNCLIQVVRGYNGTQPSAWKKGTPLRIFRALSAPAELETVTDDVLQVDGTTLQDQLIESFLVFEWNENTTCLPGCYWLEFKLLKMVATSLAMTEGVGILAALPGVSIVPSFTPSTFSAANFGCVLGEGVEWVRRFPSDGEGFLIKITDSPTAELV